jgi:sulfur carrier protein ThiS
VEEDENAIKLEDLLDDLHLDDDPNTVKENEDIVDDFIKKMENIKISKD